MASIIKVQNLRKVYRVGKEKVVALDDICLEIGEGEMCCIVGASGSGKSTLLNQLAGLEKPTKGRVLIGKHDISARISASSTWGSFSRATIFCLP